MRDVEKYYHPILKQLVPVRANLASNGSINLDLNDPDEACLLPPWWNGRYPRLTNKERITRLSEEQGHRCCYCGIKTWSKHYGEKGSYRDMATIEHYRCKTHGGTFKYTNLAMACSQCNTERGVGSPVLYLYERQGLLDLELVPKEVK